MNRIEKKRIYIHFFLFGENMIKSPAVAYTLRKIKTTPKSQIQTILDDMPLRPRDLEFLRDVAGGLSYKELAQKYNVSESRVAKWKRSICEQFLEFDQATH